MHRHLTWTFRVKFGFVSFLLIIYLSPPKRLQVLVVYLAPHILHIGFNNSRPPHLEILPPQDTQTPSSSLQSDQQDWVFWFYFISLFPPNVALAVQKVPWTFKSSFISPSQSRKQCKIFLVAMKKETEKSLSERSGPPRLQDRTMKGEKKRQTCKYCWGVCFS